MPEPQSNTPQVTCPLCGSQTPRGQFCASCGKSLQLSAAAKRDKRLILIPLAIGCSFFAIAGLGMFAAILIPNFTDALQKAKQKRTVADLRNYGTAWQSWAVDQGLGLQELGEAQEFYDLAELQPLDWQELESRLVPYYLSEMTPTDGWSNPLEAYADLETGRLALRSAGRDGVFDDESIPVAGFTTTDYDQDIVWAEGVFLRWPER